MKFCAERTRPRAQQLTKAKQSQELQSPPSLFRCCNRGIEVSLLTCMLPKGKSRENEPIGEGYKPTFAGISTLLRPGTGALR